MLTEILIFRVLKNKYSTLLEQSFFEYHIDNLLASLKVVGCIREYDIVLLCTTLQVEKNISLYGVNVCQSKRLCSCADKVIMHCIYLHRRN